MHLPRIKHAHCVHRPFGVWYATDDMEDYEWDDAKGLSNRIKHGIDFTAIERFAWKTAKTDETYLHGELRYIATGYLGN